MSLAALWESASWQAVLVVLGTWAATLCAAYVRGARAGAEDAVNRLRVAGRIPR